MRSRRTPSSPWSLPDVSQAEQGDGENRRVVERLIQVADHVRLVVQLVCGVHRRMAMVDTSSRVPASSRIRSGRYFEPRAGATNRPQERMGCSRHPNKSRGDDEERGDRPPQRYAEATQGDAQVDIPRFVASARLVRRYPAIPRKRPVMAPAKDTSGSKNGTVVRISRTRGLIPNPRLGDCPGCWGVMYPRPHRQW